MYSKYIVYLGTNLKTDRSSFQITKEIIISF